MILSPIQNTAGKLLGGYTQIRPRITQRFEGRPEFYAKYGLKSHGGIDFGYNGDGNIFASFAGQAKVIDHGKNDYGLHIKIRDNEKEIVLGHLSKVFITDGQYVHLGEKIAVMGNTGDSSGRHLHVTMKFLEGEGKAWDKKIKDIDNGWKGAVDILPFMIWWKGAGDSQTLS